MTLSSRSPGRELAPPRGAGMPTGVPTPAGTPVATSPAVPLTRKPAGGGRRDLFGSLLFLAPAAIWLLAITIYPVIATFRNSLYDETATNYVGLSNYKSVFSTASILINFRNNVIWVVIFPFVVTFLGLLFAVLTERIRWSTAFKAIIFMPIVFSATASALIWRGIFDLDPHVGMVNAAIQTASDWVSPPGLYPIDVSAGQSVAALASSGLSPAGSGSLQSSSTASAGDAVELGLIRINTATLQLVGAQTAVAPTPSPGAISGLVYRDFSPTNPTVRGQLFPDELGLPGLQLTLLRSDGSAAGTTATDPHGNFRFAGVGSGSFRVQLDARNFRSGFTGIFWLGSQSVTPTSHLSQTGQALLSVPLVDLAMIVAYLWMWAGFAMVVIGAGLTSLNRELLEAGRVDGASETQIFRRITMPLLAPVLVVVLVTMIINVLKIFDIILNMAPGSSQGEASTLALAMYNDGFTGGIHSGLSSALAVILFLLVIPAMVSNLRRIRG
jgi:alpha-glucoside transport system permease protein